MYTKLKFHDRDLSELRFLVTGGAGFIGSNIVEYLLSHGAGLVRVMDNLSEGKRENIEPFFDLENFEFLETDITDPDACTEACDRIDFVCHQAALGSVPRSIQTPLVTHAANATGFLNVLTASKDCGAKRFVYASSSSVYGDSPKLPKVESEIGNPLSPYAVTKFLNEVYAKNFALNYGIEVIGLRYFNVFGPRQKPDGPYAAVIPLFMDALLKNESPFINGDGSNSRDFTFVVNAVEANVRSLLTDNKEAVNQVYNVAFGERTTINELYSTIRDLTGASVEATFRDPRPGDIPHSLANIQKARDCIGYSPGVGISEGLKLTLDWFVGCYGLKH